MTIVEQQRQRLETGLIKMRTQVRIGNSGSRNTQHAREKKPQVVELDRMVRQLCGVEQGRQATAAAGIGTTQEVEELKQRHEELQDNVVTFVWRIEEICGEINDRVDLREEEDEGKQENHLTKQRETEESMKHLWKEVNNLNGIVGQHAMLLNS